MRPIRLLPLLLLLPAVQASAQTPRDVADLVGARGAGGESELLRRGYLLTGTQTGDDRKWSNWWHPGRRECLSVVTMDGRYDSIVSAPPADCGHSDRGGSADRERRDRRAGVGSDIGYRAPAAQIGSPSYVGGGARQGEDGNVDLALVCFGDGQRPQVANSSSWTWNRRTRRYDYGTRTELTQQHFDASLMLQFWPGGGRIRLPKKLVPPIHSRGDDENWWNLDTVSRGPDTITAQYRLNGLNKPRLTVDRRSGRITVVGSADYAFRGQCDLVGDGGQRRF